MELMAAILDSTGLKLGLNRIEELKITLVLIWVTAMVISNGGAKRVS